MQVCVGLIMIAACTMQVSFLLIGQKGLGIYISSGIGPPVDWRIVQMLCQRRRKTTNIAPTTLSAIQASSQSTFINEQPTCD